MDKKTKKETTDKTWRRWHGHGFRQRELHDCSELAATSSGEIDQWRGPPVEIVSFCSAEWVRGYSRYPEKHQETEGWDLPGWVNRKQQAENLLSARKLDDREIKVTSSWTPFGGWFVAENILIWTKERFVLSWRSGVVEVRRVKVKKDGKVIIIIIIIMNILGA